MRTIAIYIDSDSQFFGTKALALYFRNAGWQVDIFVPNIDVMPQALFREINDSYSVQEINIEDFCFSGMSRKYYAIGIYSKGSLIRRFRELIDFIYTESGYRPYIFTGYNGVVYEKYEEGIFWRCGYDNILVNGSRDFEIFKAILSGTVCREQGLLPVGLNKQVNAQSSAKDSKKIVFAEQVIVPAKVDDRKYMFALLSAFAENNSDWEVIVKPRVACHEKTFHGQVFHPEEYKGWPGNVSISYDSLSELLQGSCCLLSISSTAFFDAVSCGVVPICIMDFGVNSAHGSHYFVGCGTEVLLRNQPKVEALLDLQIDPNWLVRTGFNLSNFKALEDEILSWSPTSLPAAFPERILNTTHSGQERVQQSPRDVMLHYKAKILFADKNYRACAKLIEDPLANFGSNPNASYLAAECYEALSDFDTALRWLDKTQQLRPSWKKIWLRTIVIRWKKLCGFIANW